MAVFEDLDRLLGGLHPIHTRAVVGRDHGFGFQTFELSVQVVPELLPEEQHPLGNRGWPPP